MIPINYHYPLSAAIYKLINKADEEYAAFLHQQGYGATHKKFKLFTFSNLQLDAVLNGDRLMLKKPSAKLLIGFYVPEAGEKFVGGVFMNQFIEIADNKTTTRFIIEQLEILPLLPQQNIDDVATAVFEPISPCVVGRKKQNGHYDYLAPDDPDFTTFLKSNLLEKLRLFFEEADPSRLQIDTIPPTDRAKSKLITLKANTSAETKIKGYLGFQLSITAPVGWLQMALDAGMGLHNAQGMGCMAVKHFVGKPQNLLT
jgi:CRISPR-associated endoribonuclease Cas6